MSDLPRPALSPLHLAQYAVASALMALVAQNQKGLAVPMAQLRQALSLMAEADPTLPHLDIHDGL